ncbi:unnamed protein product [Paramecium octaurelia]|uniref:Uncharacterized protein n=1 Tax=Paramecium octaurelia TaxID=43137 RepID=A0A8S1TIZ8_PAROT|nr:unnamed protein product [Paramecium octaurelia]
MKEDKSAQYVYYNLVTSTHRYKKIFGEQIEYFQLKVSEKLPNKNEITVIMRFFPIQFNNEKLQSLQDMRAEELFIYQGYKYGIFKTKDFETAENYRNNLLSYLFSKNIKMLISLQWKRKNRKILIIKYFLKMIVSILVYNQNKKQGFHKAHPKLYHKTLLINRINNKLPWLQFNLLQVLSKFLKKRISLREFHYLK